MINSFKNEYEFLSNFSFSVIYYNGQRFYNAEAAFQAQKTLNMEERKRFSDLSPSEAKKLGRRVRLRKDWESVKDDIMYDVVSYKFHQTPLLGKLLLETGDKALVEGNWWGDTYWGECRGQGQNKLGKILMRVRKEMREKL